MSELRYFAVVCAGDKVGYVLDYYPNEKRTYKRENGSLIIGDYATSEQAMEAVRRRLEISCDA